MTLRIHDLYLVAFGVRMAIHLALSFAVNPATPTSGIHGGDWQHNHAPLWHADAHILGKHLHSAA